MYYMCNIIYIYIYIYTNINYIKLLHEYYTGPYGSTWRFGSRHFPCFPSLRSSPAPCACHWPAPPFAIEMPRNCSVAAKKMDFHCPDITYIILSYIIISLRFLHKILRFSETHGKTHGKTRWKSPGFFHPAAVSAALILMNSSRHRRRASGSVSSSRWHMAWMARYSRNSIPGRFFGWKTWVFHRESIDKTRILGKFMG